MLPLLISAAHALYPDLESVGAAFRSGTIVSTCANVATLCLALQE